MSDFDGSFTRPKAPETSSPPPPQVAPMYQAYLCPYCGSPHPPQIVKRLGPLGWVVLVLGLFFCLVGSLFCLLFIEEHRVCPSCGARLARG